MGTGPRSGSVIGLAPSAAAAQVLGDELGIETENTAKWLTEWRRIPELTARRDRLALNLARHAYPRSPSAARLRARLAETDQAISERRLKPGQLVMIDESSLAGTFTLDELVSAATTAGSKILLLGDCAQMSSVEAGGAFSLLVKDRGDLVPELTDIRRFSSEWEKAASVELRARERLGHRCLRGPRPHHIRRARESLLDAIYAAWKADVEAGKSSLMIAGDSATVAELNRRARTARVAEGTVADSGLAIADGQRAGVGDEIVTRQNNRLLTTGRSWVKNGDRFVVAATNPDGTMAVRRGSGGAEVVLPADYVAQHVELGYATTAYRSQGRTVDTTHSMVSPTTTREVLYVAATRGRESNMLYVDTTFDPDPATGHDGTIAPQSASEVLAGVLANEGADLSAHETLERAQRQAEDFSVLAAEYETLARAAQQQRWDELLCRSGLEPGRLEQVRQSPAYGPLLAALRDAEARGLDVERTFPGLVAARSFDDAEDPAAVIRGRVDRWAQASGSARRAGTDLIAGLIPRAVGVTDPDMARGLEERDEAMQRRARALAEQAIEQNQVWVRRLGVPPYDPLAREQLDRSRHDSCRLPGTLEHRRRSPTSRLEGHSADDRSDQPAQRRSSCCQHGGKAYLRGRSAPRRFGTGRRYQPGRRTGAVRRSIEKPLTGRPLWNVSCDYKLVNRLVCTKAARRRRIGTLLAFPNNVERPRGRSIKRSMGACGAIYLSCA